MNISEKLFTLTQQKNIPLICTFELTRRCNLRCRHCYIDFSNARKIISSELSTREVKSILRQLADAGSLYLVLTGGEIFLRPDILEICAWARELSFDVRLFTNGTLVTEAAARALSRLNLAGVELSLYGREKTHEYATRRAGSFRRTMATARILKKYGIPVTVKSPLMRFNFKEYPWLQHAAGRLAAKLRLDPVLAPKDNGEKGILRHRLSTAQMEKLYADPSLYQKSDRSPGSADLQCSAGHNFVSIGYDGTVYPCLQLPVPLGNAKRERFSNIWSSRNKPLRAYRDIESSDLSACNTCEISSFCQRCPGLALLEHGDIKGPSGIACRTARLLIHLHPETVNKI